MMRVNAGVLRNAQPALLYVDQSQRSLVFRIIADVTNILLSGETLLVNWKVFMNITDTSHRQNRAYKG